MVGIYPFFIENLARPVYDLVEGTSIFNIAHALKKTQWLSRDEIELIQAQGLKRLLRHAYETVPYYRRVFKQRSLSPGDIRNVNDLLKLPVLTKDDIRKNFVNMISRRYPRNRLISRSTSGSGDKLFFHLDRGAPSWESAAAYRAYGWAGYRLGNRCCMLVGSSEDIEMQRKWVNRVQYALARIFPTNTYVMSDEALNRIATMLQRFNPEIIRGYTSSIFMVAKHLTERGIESVRPRAVITAAETLFEDMRAEIEGAFGCPVFDNYVSREFSAIAAECEEHRGYHISSENVLLEFVKERKHVAPSEDGVILVTGLRNFGMPFIRYQIGDVGRPSDGDCGCGRGLPMMSSLKGRVTQYLAVYDPRSKHIVPVSATNPGVFSTALKHVPIDSYRIIQESLDEFLIKAVKRRGYTEEHTEQIKMILRRYLGDGISIDIEFVDYLPPLPSGKRSAFISKINPFEQY